MARRNRTANPGTVKPNMHKMFDGKGKTRPIPLVVDSSERLAINAAAADRKPLGHTVKMPSKPRPTGADTILGSRVKGAAKVNGGVYNPSNGTDNIV